MVVRLIEAIFIGTCASTIVAVIARKIAHVANKHFEHEDRLDEEEKWRNG